MISQVAKTLEKQKRSRCHAGGLLHSALSRLGIRAVLDITRSVVAPGNFNNPCF